MTNGCWKAGAAIPDTGGGTKGETGKLGEGQTLVDREEDFTVADDVKVGRNGGTTSEEDIPERGTLEAVCATAGGPAGRVNQVGMVPTCPSQAVCKE